MAFWLPPQANQRAIFISPSAVIKHFHFGYNETLADGFWIRSLQDIDYCERQISAGQCSNMTWLFKMIDVITELSPTFRMPHAMGGIALSVLVGDVQGAAVIFKKAVDRFPDDWTISYKAGYHALIEEKDELKAASYFRTAAQNGAPPWVYSLSGGLFNKNQKKEIARQMVEEMKAANVSPGFIERLTKKIDSDENR